LKTKLPYTILLTISVPLILLGSLNVAFAQPGWSLPVSGKVSTSLSLTMDQLAALPPTIVQADIYCCGVFVAGGNWLGPRLSQILQMAELNSQAESVDFTAIDGYQVTIPLTTAMREDVIVAHQLNGEPLAEGLRLVIPGANGNVWIAGINQIIVTAVPSNNPTAAFILPNFNTHTSSPTPTPTTGANTPTPSATAAPFATPTQTPSPSPSQSPSASPSVSPSPLPSLTQASTSRLPLEAFYTVASIAIVAIAAAVILILKKQKN
jgi:DMSO/TMAO reductase YedYZ molybdopterin-dependent catalytic subunit